MPDFSRIIRMAYLRILGREPDPSGMAHYNGQMNGGMSEATLREALLRSPEYAEKNPDRPAAATRARGARARRTKAGRRHPAPSARKDKSTTTR